MKTEEGKIRYQRAKQRMEEIRQAAPMENKKMILAEISNNSASEKMASEEVELITFMGSNYVIQ